MTADQYQEFQNSCIQELQAKQAATAEILLFADKRIDLTEGTIEWIDEDEVWVRAEVVLLGSWGTRSESWNWAWARPEFLGEHSFAASEKDAWGMVAVVCHQLGGAGVYLTTANDSNWFFLIRNLTSLKPPEAILNRAQLAAESTLLQGTEGVVLLNLLRERFPQMRLNLVGADLRGQVRPWAHDLHVQTLLDRDYLRPYQAPDLTGANLSQSRFDDAILRGVTLRNASFDGSSLVNADLSGADLRGASLQGAFLNGVNFTRSKLAGADFAGAELARTLLTDVDLSEVRGLNEVHHLAHSEISMSTLIASHFEITPTFLRKAGVSRGLIEDLMKGKRFSKTYQTCFLSYSSSDSEFAGQLYNSLVDAGVQVFWDYFGVLPGEYLEDQLVEAIREHDRLLLILSEASMASKWVMREIELARYHKPESLLPIRLCGMEDVKNWTAQHESLPDLGSLLPISDFSDWKTPEKYDHAFTLLLKSFSGGVDFRPPKEDTINKA